MRLGTLLIAALAALALAASPALAQQDESSTDDHGAHHPSQDQPKSQEKPNGGMGGGMMGGGMMGQGGMMGGRDTDGMMGCPRMGDMMGSRGMKGGGMMMHSRPMMEARLAFIKADLDITEAQTPQWDAYADAVRARQEKMTAMHEDKMKAKGGTAIERMNARIKSMETVLDGLKVLKGPAEALYASLSDEQKKKADQLLGGRCGMM